LLPTDPRSSRVRLLILIAGVLALQSILHGPCLIGARLELPLEDLRRVVLNESGTEHPAWRSLAYSDIDRVYEPRRRFLAKEARQGRLALWDPQIFAGAPTVGVRFYPGKLLSLVFASPVALAWVHLLHAVFATVGAFLFFRQALSVSFWPAAIGAWSFPLTGFSVLWHGFPVGDVITWFPWLLLAARATVLRPLGLGVVGLAALTGIVLTTVVDVAALVLLVTGLYALYLLLSQGSPHSRSRITGVLALATAVFLGFGLAAPHVLSFGDHALSGARVTDRNVGFEARPPEGLSSMIQFVVPDRFGSPKVGIELYSTQLERAATGFSGIVYALVLLPLGWRVRERRSCNLFWFAIAILGASWSLGLPGFTHVFRTYPLELLSYNRFVFATSFAVLCIGVTGLDALWGERLRRHASDYVFLAATLILGLACFYWMLHPFEPVATQLSRFVSVGGSHPIAPTMAIVEQLQANLAKAFLVSAVFALLACAAWIGFRRLGATRAGAAIVGGLAVFELVVFAWDREPRGAPEDYYPPVPAFEYIASAEPGRMLCLECMPPNLTSMYDVSDIRGYDAVDPLHYIELLKAASGSSGVRGREYARLERYVPLLGQTEEGELSLHPILDLLNLRYLVTVEAAAPGVKPSFEGPIYRVYENSSALSRAFVPRSVRTADYATALREMAHASFQPRTVAYVAETLDLPAEALGHAEIENETPTRVSIRVSMKTPGLVVLADRFDEDWHASVDGVETPVMRTNYALRGVVVPVGEHFVEFGYEPRALRLGVLFMLFSLGVMFVWVVVVWRRERVGSA